MHHLSSNFYTEDNIKIHTEAWLSKQDTRGVVVIVHGAAEHIGRYAHVAGTFAHHGYAVYGYDQRGHGKSGGKRGYFSTFQYPVNDLAQYINLIRTTQAEHPIFLYGHSMGSLVALAHILQSPAQTFAGIITTGVPLSGDENLPDFLLTWVKTLNQISPDAPLLSLDLTGMSRDPAVLATWTTDPHVNLSLMPVRTTLGIVGTMRHIRAHMMDITDPILIMHGGADRIVAPAGSRLLYEGVSSMDKTLRIYPELYHEVVNEPEREMVLGEMVSWLKQR